MAKQQKVTISIPKGYTPSERKAISHEIINSIIRRTQRGFDKNGQQFKGYSAAYKASLDFRIAGKGSTVDLTLTEEMLSELDELSNRSGKITIGYEVGDKINGKVEGNRKGTYGQKRAVTKPRDFLGLSQTALNQILQDFPLGDTEKKAQKRLENTLLTLQAIERAGDLDDGTGEPEDSDDS